jgi:NIMA-interacting peptidyl-prolyl cis-trans isomerase 4
VVAARHVLCEKQGKINEAYKKLQDGWLDNGDKVPPAEFAKVIGRLIGDRAIRASISLLRLV